MELLQVGRLWQVQCAGAGNAGKGGTGQGMRGVAVLGRRLRLRLQLLQEQQGAQLLLQLNIVLLSPAGQLLHLLQQLQAGVALQGRRLGARLCDAGPLAAARRRHARLVAPPTMAGRCKRL